MSDEIIRQYAFDKSPLLALPKEEKQRLVDTRDPRLQALVADIYASVWNKSLRIIKRKDQLLTIKKSVASDYWLETVYRSFVSFSYKEDTSAAGSGKFSTYLTSSMRHAAARTNMDESYPLNLSYDTCSILSKLNAYMTSLGWTAADLCKDTETLKTLAENYKTSVDNLRYILIHSPNAVYLDDTLSEDSDDTFKDMVRDEHDSMQEGISNFELADAIEKIAVVLKSQAKTLEMREKYAKKYGYIWSKALLQVVRMKEKGTVRARIQLCQPFLPLEEKGLLWGLVLMHDYVDYLITGPAQSLAQAAANPLIDPAVVPCNTSLALFLGVSKQAITDKAALLKKHYTDIMDSAYEK